MAVRTPQPFIVERILTAQDVIDEHVATLSNVTIAHAFFDLMMELEPDRAFMLRHGTRIIRDHPPGEWRRREDEASAASDRDRLQRIETLRASGMYPTASAPLPAKPTRKRR